MVKDRRDPQSYMMESNLVPRVCLVLGTSEERNVFFRARHSRNMPTVPAIRRLRQED